MMRGLALAAAILVGTRVGFAGELPRHTIEGRVLDATGNPAADVDVATFWSANGTKGYELEKAPNLADPQDLKRFWGDLGRMDPYGKADARRARSGPDGTFRVEAGPHVHHVLAMSRDRAVGALGIEPKQMEGRPLTLRLGPLVRVHGEIRGPGAGERPAWTHVYSLVPDEETRPFDTCRLVSCGSYEARFSMLLPPGRYRLDAYNDDNVAAVQPPPELTITGAEAEVDMGMLQLSKSPEAIVPHMQRLKAERRSPDLVELVGMTPPHVYAVDARGVPRDWQPGRAAGRWQLLNFWGRGCVPCLEIDLPALMDFKERYAAHADRFEIITIYMDPEGKIRTVDAVDRSIRSIVEHVWKKPLGLPVLVDPSYQTAEAWGLSGFGQQVLIDPTGKVVEGDVETLKGILSRSQDRTP